MKKSLLQLLPVGILIFAAVMTAREQAMGPAIRISTNGPIENCVDVWSATSVPSAVRPRSYHTAVWTGTEMIVWGGLNANTPLNFGGRYDPGTDSWTTTRITNAPTGRFWHTAVWTGTEMIVWGGYDLTNALNTGGRYNPATDTWTAMSTTNAPSARVQHTAVWTGSEMIVWGGGNDSSSGGKYNPATDTWTPVSNTNAPSGRSEHTAVWTGSEMIVWGGTDHQTPLLNTGGKYSPSTDTWTQTNPVSAPAPRRDHTAVWTGSEMIVWSGSNGVEEMKSGGKYNPGTDTWTATSTINAPPGRESFTAVWTGSEMIAWGGLDSFGDPQYLNTGGRYNPGSDTWTLTTTSNATEPRAYHTAVWTGRQMIVWGGSGGSGSSTGGRYCVGPFENTCGWSPAPAYPVETFGGGITSLGDYLYSFGGGTAASITKAYKFDGVTWTPLTPLPSPEAAPSAVNDGTYIYLVGDNVWKYDPVTDTYTPLARYHVETTGHKSVYLGGKIYKMCGAVSGAQAPEGSNALEIYDIAANTWTNGPNVPYAVTGISAFAFGNSVYVAGGSRLPPSPLNHAFRYDITTNAWGDDFPFFPFLPEARTDAAVAAYSNGAVLAGGVNESFQILDSALFWDSASNQWIYLPAKLAPRTGGIGAVLSGSFYYLGGRADLTPNGTITNQKLSCTILPTPTPTPTPPAVTPIFANISTRGRVETVNSALIGGFIVTGTLPKKVLIRGLGPSLPLPGVVADPYLYLRDSSGSVIRANDSWRSEQQNEIIATTIPPSNDLEAAIVATLPANGAAYTATVVGLNNGTGIGVVEVYDLSQTASSRLANISTRGLVQTGDNVLIGGLIVLGQDPMRVILRAIGPSLPVPGALADPMLELRDGNGGLIAANDNWRSDQEAEIIATTIAPTNDLDSAIVRDLPPGNYTGIVSGVGNTTGVGLVEAYNLSN